MLAVKQVVNLFINIVIVGLTRSRCSEAFSRAAGNDLRFYSSRSIIHCVDKHKEMFVFCFGQKVKNGPFLRQLLRTEKLRILRFQDLFLPGLLAYQPADSSVHLRASLVSHRCPFFVGLRAQIGPFCLTLRQTNYLLWRSFIHTSFTSHLNLPPLTSPLLPAPVCSAGPLKKCLLGNLARARLSPTAGLSPPICSHLV